MSLQLAPTDQMFHKSSSVTSISDFKLQILMKPTTVSQIRSNNPGTSNCRLAHSLQHSGVTNFSYNRLVRSSVCLCLTYSADA